MFVRFLILVFLYFISPAAKAGGVGLFDSNSHLLSEGVDFHLSGGTAVNDKVLHRLSSLSLDSEESLHVIKGSHYANESILLVCCDSESYLNGTINSEFGKLSVINPSGVVVDKGLSFGSNVALTLSTAEKLMVDGERLLTVSEIMSTPESEFTSLSPYLGSTDGLHAVTLNAAISGGYLTLSGGDVILNQATFSRLKGLDLRGQKLRIDASRLLFLRSDFEFLTLDFKRDISVNQSLILSNSGRVSIRSEESINISTTTIDGRYAQNEYGVVLSAPVLRIQNASGVLARPTRGGSKGISINADNIFLGSPSDVKSISGLASSGSGTAEDRRGSIVIRGFNQESARQLILAKGAINLRTNRAKEGTIGGDLDIKADSIVLSEGSVISTAGSEEASSGSVFLHFDQLQMANSKLSTSNQSPYRGSLAGNITLQGNHIQLDDGAVITATASKKGEAGNINISQLKDTLVMSADSQLLAKGDNLEDGRGGNIAIGGAYQFDPSTNQYVFVEGIAPVVVVLKTDEGHIPIVAEGGIAGGNVAIVAHNFLGSEDQISVASTSEKGVAGTVNILQPSANSTERLLRLSDDFLQKASFIRDPCQVSVDDTESSLVIKKRRSQALQAESVPSQVDTASVCSSH